MSTTSIALAVGVVLLLAAGVASGEGFMVFVGLALITFAFLLHSLA